jgi:hypothetical protein
LIRFVLTKRNDSLIRAAYLSKPLDPMDFKPKEALEFGSAEPNHKNLKAAEGKLQNFKEFRDDEKPKKKVFYLKKAKIVPGLLFSNISI